MKALKQIVFHSNSSLKVILPSYLNDAVIVIREEVTDFKVWLLE